MISDILENDIDKKNIEIENIISGFIREFELTETPIEVSFRALLPDLKKNDRFSHLIHTYPAKLLVHIPYFFLNNNIFSKPGDIVLDPFCGTGTVLLESILSGRNALGADANPLARLIGKVKTRILSSQSLVTKLKIILSNNYVIDDLQDYPSVVNLDYWFNQQTKQKLLQILNNVKIIESESVREFFLVCFSNLIKKVSYADPRITVPVKLNKNRYIEGSASYKRVKKRLLDLEYINVLEKFETICRENIERVKSLEGYLKSENEQVSAEIISTDARNLTISLN